MEILLANQADCSKVIDFYHELIAKMQPYAYHPTWIIGVYPDDDYLRQLVLNGQVFFGAENKHIIAAMVLNNTPNDVYDTVSWQVDASPADATVVHLLGVLPEYWGKGLGKELLAFAEHHSKAKGQKALRLDVMMGNLPARRLYERSGFKEIETKEMFYESTGLTGFAMYEKDLRDAPLPSQ